MTNQFLKVKTGSCKNQNINNCEEIYWLTSHSAIFGQNRLFAQRI